MMQQSMKLNVVGSEMSSGTFNNRHGHSIGNIALFVMFKVSKNYLIFWHYNENVQNYAIFLILCKNCQIMQKIV